MTPEQIVDAVRLVMLTSDRTFFDIEEMDRLAPAVDSSTERYDDLRTRSSERAHLIAAGETVARLLGADPTGIEAEVDERLKRRHDAMVAEWRAEQSAKE